jgi:hypothetical protein
MSTNLTSSIPVSSALIKPKRENIKKFDSFSIKPPIVVASNDGSDNHSYACVYVSNNYRETKKPCTFDVWKRCEGRSIPGQARDGLDSRLHNDFIIIQDDKDKVIDIDIIPKTYYTSKAVLPDSLQNKHDIVLKINSKTGGVEVLQCPAGVSKPLLRKLLDALDKIDAIQTGDSIPGGFEVINVSGNHVSVVATTRN